MLRTTPTLLRSSLASSRRLMSRRPIVGGNWKCNPASASKLPELIANINACDTAKCDVYVCPSPLHVALCTGKFTNGAEVAPQNCNFTGTGAYTGEMAVDQMADMGIKCARVRVRVGLGHGHQVGRYCRTRTRSRTRSRTLGLARTLIRTGTRTGTRARALPRWVLLGHSERRGEFGLPTPKESNALLATKLAYVLEKGLNCVFCIGEPLPIREKGIAAVTRTRTRTLYPYREPLPLPLTRYRGGHRGVHRAADRCQGWEIYGCIGEI
jgi:hypothetical protein